MKSALYMYIHVYIHVCCIYMYLQHFMIQEEKYLLKQLVLAVSFI